MILIQLQHQLEVTSSLCQNMLLEQAQQQQHGNNLLTPVGAGNNLLSHWGFPPPPYPYTPHPQTHSVTAGKSQLEPAVYLFAVFSNWGYTGLAVVMFQLLEDTICKLCSEKKGQAVFY
jgi:hypothetical protein